MNLLIKNAKILTMNESMEIIENGSIGIKDNRMILGRVIVHVPLRAEMIS
jgi:hypothetical protein